MAKRALAVLTSVERYPHMPKATGLWFAEIVHFYDVMVKAGWQVDLCNPRGGYTPLDPLSLKTDYLSELDWKYYGDVAFRNKVATAAKPEQVNPSDYKCIFFAGGYGVLWDFVDNPSLQALARNIYERGGIVSSVCHGAVGLLNIKLSDGTNLVAGKTVTGFSNAEEDTMGTASELPFLAEDELKKRGAKYTAQPPWTPFAVVDGRLITGQNPLSGKAVAEKVLVAAQQLA